MDNPKAYSECIAKQIVQHLRYSKNVGLRGPVSLSDIFRPKRATSIVARVTGVYDALVFVTVFRPIG